MLRLLLANALQLVGVVGVSVALWFMWPPLGVLAGALSLILAGVLIEGRK